MGRQQCSKASIERRKSSPLSLTKAAVYQSLIHVCMMSARSSESLQSSVDMVEAEAFSVLIPAVTVNGVPESRPEKSSPEEQGAEKDETHGRVLVVEDNDEIRFMMSLVLEEHCPVDAAGSFDHAVQHLAEQDYEAVYIDIDLGEQRTGVDLVKMIHEEADASKPWLIACTAYAMPGDREKFLAEGFDHYIGKPFTDEELLAALEEVRSFGDA